MTRHRAPSRAEQRRAYLRSRSRRRVGVLGAAVAVTALVGTASVVLVPTLRDDTATTTTTAAALETGRLDPVPAPVVTPEVEEVVEATAASAGKDPAPPQGSGTGRRIVFDQGDQRVWLIDSDDDVVRTYLVSGSRFDNLQPGSYQVQSRSRHATAFDGSGTMEYFVRFATGFSEPIGFHSVPRYNSGELEQTKAQLGTPLSAGCVRQWMPDAIALWDFAPIGTPVVVTA